MSVRALAVSSRAIEWEHDVAREASFGVLGDPGTRLLSGPRAGGSPESADAHVARLGPLDLSSMDPALLRAAIADSGLEGRGGGQFPVSVKLELAASSRGVPLVVVNASEGEPASRKDHTLVAMRPNLVLDGAMVAARAVGAHDVVIYLHDGRSDAAEALERALADRAGDIARVRIVGAPARYVAGETSAVVSFLEGTGAIPTRRPVPVAAVGVRGHPTVVSNAETVSHLALIARFGPSWFRGAGDGVSPGSTLVTLAGAVAASGSVVEVLGQPPLGDVLELGGVTHAPLAVLVGGYAGTWIDGRAAMRTPLARGALASRGARLGCGLLAVLPQGKCGLRATARLVTWLASESAGQCGPCVFGLPEIARVLGGLSEGTGTRRDVRRLRLLTASVMGRGDCGHPSGVAALVDSALVVFADDLEQHARGRPCEGGDASADFPVGNTGMS